MLYYDKAGFPECPPALKLVSLLTDLAALEPAHTACRHRENRMRNETQISKLHGESTHKHGPTG